MLYAFMSKWCGLESDKLHTYTQEQLAHGLYLTAHDNVSDKDFVLVGAAEMPQIVLFPRAEMVSRQVATLRAEVQQTRAESEARVTDLERQINSLLAIEDCTSEAQP